jgi:methylmalonyl-CoA mutase
MARLSDLAHRRLPITGVSSFPDLDEAALEHEMADLPRVMADAEAVLGARQRPLGIAAIMHPMRDAQGFERLRDLSDVALAEDGARPRVFIVGLGPLARHAEELSMVQNAFAAGGIEAVTGPVDADPAAIAAAFAAAGTDIACLCGIDRKAPDEAAPVIQALLGQGAIAIYAGGRPDDAIKAMGVDGFIHARANLMGLLEDVQSLLMGEAA